MDLLATLILLYGVQCAVFVPREAALFVRPVRRWHIGGGPGWRLTHPVPSAKSILATRFPFRLQNGQLSTRGSPSRFDWRAPSTQPESFEAGTSVTVDVTGALVRIDGRPYYRAPSKAAAARTGSWLRSLEGAPLQGIRGRVEEAVTRSLSLDRYREASKRFRVATRWLGWLSDLYAGFLFIGIPALIVAAYEERGLQIAFVGIGALHVATLVALMRAHRKLDDGKSGDLFERILSAALYPPLLLRAHADLRSELLCDFHPAVVAAEQLSQRERPRFLRAELLRLEHAAAAPSSSSDDEDAEAEAAAVDEVAVIELQTLIATLRECGETRDSLLARSHDTDESARAYCPICSADYLRAAGRCSDCGVELVAHGGDPPRL